MRILCIDFIPQIMNAENLEAPDLNVGPENAEQVGAKLRGLKQEVEAGKAPGSIKTKIDNIAEREALRENLDDEQETREFWGQFFGDTFITAFLTKVSLFGTQVHSGEIKEEDFWKNVKKFEKELKDEGVDVENRLVAHRLNSVKKIKKAVERGEKQVEFDVRAKGNKLYLSHDPRMFVVGGDRSFDKAMAFLAQHPDVKVMIDIKELSAAQALVKSASKYPGLRGGNVMLMSHNPQITHFLSQSNEVPGVPLVFHYIPLGKAPLPVRTTVKMLGGPGVKQVADIVDKVYPGSFYGTGAQLTVNEDWEQLKGKKNADEMYCAWDNFPPDNLIEEMKATGREVWISVPYELMPDGMQKWADERGVKLLVHGADNMTETADALEKTDGMVVSDSADDTDELLGEGEIDADEEVPRAA